MPQNNKPKVAILLPCHNEEGAISGVIKAFRKVMPDADIYAYDNASTDNTYAEAKAAGAIVGREMRKGKGNVVRRMFADIDADIYVMADGDGTYDAEALPAMVDHLVHDNLDMIVGTRAKDEDEEVYRAGHRFGNRMLNTLVHLSFGQIFTDMLSGYRVFSRRFVKSFPSISQGFEIETELTIHALQQRLPVAEIPTRYYKRAGGTQSKLSTYRDGFRILNFILFFLKEGRPFFFFGLISLLLAILSLAIGIPVVLEFLETGLVPRLPSAVLSMGLMISAVLSFICAVILDSVSNARQEQKRLRYLAYSAPQKPE